MKDLTKLAVMICLGAALAAGCKSDGDDDHEHGTAEATEAVIQQDDVPDRVSSAFKKAFPNASVNKVSKETYKDGTVHYEYEFTENGKKREVEFDANGELLEKH